MSTKNEPLQPTFEDHDIMTFGQHKGRPMSDVPASYLAWIKDQRITTDIKVYNYVINNWKYIVDDLPDRTDRHS